MAMRHRYWDDCTSAIVQQEKLFFQRILVEEGIFPEANLDDARYLFFSLPSHIILKGYAQGFQTMLTHQLICQYIQTHQQQLKQRAQLKIQF
jgi:hypothetical protein